jgi:iron complex outermembrane receptor protein
MLSADYADLHSSCCAYPVTMISPGSNLAEKGLLPGFPGFPPGFLSDTNSQVDILGDDALTNNKSRGVSLRWDQALGDFTLTSITAYRTWNALQNQVASENTTPISVAHFFFSGINQHQTSEELRIASPKNGPIDYVAGLYFYKDGISDHENWLIDFAPLTGTPPGSFTQPVNYTSVTDTLNYAAFGEANFHVSDSVTLIAGARETHERVDFDLAGVYLPLVHGPIGAADSDAVNNLSWRLGERWEINKQNMTYATVSRGFKGPAFNGNSTILGNAQKVNPEVATSYELGWKSELLDQRLRTNLAVFLTNLDQFQVSGYVLPPGSTVAQQFLINAGQLRSEGVEFELEAVPVKDLSINLNAAYIDARYTDFPNAPCWSYPTQTPADGCVIIDGQRQQNLDGKQTADTPRFSFNINGNYDVILPSLPFNAFVRADFAWKGKVQWDPTDSPSGIEGAYGLLGGGLGIASKDGRFTLTGYGRNLTNRFYTDGIRADATQQIRLLPDYRRTWGIRFDYRL